MSIYTNKYVYYNSEEKWKVEAAEAELCWEGQHHHRDRLRQGQGEGNQVNSIHLLDAEHLYNQLPFSLTQRDRLMKNYILMDR